MMMANNNQGRIWGSFSVNDEQSEIIKCNLLVNRSRRNMAAALGKYPSDNSRNITVLKAGRGSVMLPNPVVSNTGLVDTTPWSKHIADTGTCAVNPDVYWNEQLCLDASAIWYSSPQNVEYGPFPAYNSVTFQVIMERLDGNIDGSSTWYREAGLYTNNGSLFARVVFPPVEKTPQNRLIFTWSINF